MVQRYGLFFNSRCYLIENSPKVIADLRAVLGGLGTLTLGLQGVVASAATLVVGGCGAEVFAVGSVLVVIYGESVGQLLFLVLDDGHCSCVLSR